MRNRKVKVNKPNSLSKVVVRDLSPGSIVELEGTMYLLLPENQLTTNVIDWNCYRLAVLLEENNPVKTLLCSELVSTWYSSSVELTIEVKSDGY